MAEDADKTGDRAVDTLSMAKLGEMYGFARDAIRNSPELVELFQWAAKQGPDLPDEAFLTRLRGTDWWRKSNASWKKAYRAEYGGDTTWETEIFPDAVRKVTNLAARIGVDISEANIKNVARQSLYNGWDDEDLQSALVSGTKGFGGLTTQLREGEDLYGAALRTYESLRIANEDSNSGYSPAWLKTQASRILDPNDAVDEAAVLEQIAAKAKTKYPSLADQIGIRGDQFVTVRDAASPYINTLAEVFELDPRTINLNDRLLSQALRDTDDKGNQVLMPLWKLEEAAIADDRWLNTSAGKQTYDGIANLISETFGVGF